MPRTVLALLLSFVVSGAAAPAHRQAQAPRADAGVKTYPLVALQTSQDPSCRGGNQHAWPLGLGPEDCHGWRAVDPAGRQHDNSARAIQCRADGSFAFTQYAGNLTCQGSGVTKIYKPDTCEQDFPPVLHTKAIDLSCCSDPKAPACHWGVPSITVPGGTVFLNGKPIAK